MAGHNTGHKKGKDSQNTTRKKRQADKKTRGGRVNKYAKFSHAAEEQAKIARAGEEALNTRVCPKCHNQVKSRDWDDHPCNLRFCYTCYKNVRECDWHNHPCNLRKSGW
jgi:hypothetical protein